MIPFGCQSAEIKPLISALLQADFRISEGIIKETLRLEGEQG